MYIDLSVSRNFLFSERMKLQFRAEAFNLTNTKAFGLPNSNVSGGSRGVITSLAADPRIMQFCAEVQFLRNSLGHGCTRIRTDKKRLLVGVLSVCIRGQLSD